MIFMASKWVFNSKVNLKKDENLQVLIQAFLIDSPVPGASVRGRSLKDLGWKGGALNTLQAEMRKPSGFPTSACWISSSAKNVPERLKDLKRLDSFDCSFEFAVHTIKDDLNKTEALLYLIRNSFAHGGFRKCKYGGEVYYAFENRQGSTLKGRAVIKESTLLAWAKLLSKPREKN